MEEEADLISFLVIPHKRWPQPLAQGSSSRAQRGAGGGSGSSRQPTALSGWVLRAASPCFSCVSIVWKGKEQRQTFVSP